MANHVDNPATIKDIAKRLNISLSTVSRALRNAPDVSEETRQAVMSLSQELNYQPNRLALSLRQNQTHTIGVIIPNLDYVLSQMVRGIDEVALEAGYTVMVCQSNESFGREILNTQRLLESLVDGFIISVSSETKSFEHFKKIQDRNLPVVVFDRITPHLSAPSVRLDNQAGGFMATEHLIEQGYKRIQNTNHHYGQALRYGITEDEASRQIKKFNESGCVGFIPAYKDAVEYVTALHNLGWRFEVISSLDKDKYAQQLREKYDYIVLAYSGGADSCNVLNSFLDNGIPIDDIIRLP